MEAVVGHPFDNEGARPSERWDGGRFEVADVQEPRADGLSSFDVPF